MRDLYTEVKSENRVHIQSVKSSQKWLAAIVRLLFSAGAFCQLNCIAPCYAIRVLNAVTILIIKSDTFVMSVSVLSIVLKVVNGMKTQASKPNDIVK